uniref:SGNH/GDSL hydrolase family protein n=1 Tax=Schlesneria paludicola TaxID=360056 RepID=A0A7C4LLL7_9PLAN
MVAGLLRWLRTICTAVFVLVSGLALTEVALRIQRVRTPDDASLSATHRRGDCPLAVPSWHTGWELQPLATARVRGAQGVTIKFRTNSLGFRGEEVAVPKPPGLFRIVCLGDESILAPEVPDDATFCGQLQTLLQARTEYRVEVINAGLPRGCPLTAWLAARTRIVGLQPDLVLLHVTWSDLADDRELRRFAISDRHGVPLGCPHPQLATPACVDLGPWRRQFCVLEWGCRQLSQRVEQTKVPASSIWSNVERLAESAEFVDMIEPVKHLAKLCETTYCRCIVWTTPYPWQLSGSATAEGSARREAGVAANGLVTSRTPFETLMRTCAEWKVPCLDASSAFPQGSAADALFLPDRPRWSPTGHRLVAEFVGEQLIRHVPGPWSSPYFQRTTVPANYQSVSEPARIAR